MTLDDLNEMLIGARSKHARSVADASKLVKGALILCGAFVAGAAQFWTWSPGHPAEVSQIVGIAACVAVFLGGIFVFRTEQDASSAIEVATKALESARDTDSQIAKLEEFYADFDRLVRSYQICLTMRGAIEQSSIGSAGDLNDLIASIFDLVVRELVIASGFAQPDRWTVGVYRAFTDDSTGRVELRCIAHDRAIKCGIEEARSWPEGVGIAGIAFTNAREIVIPDLRAEGVAAIFGPSGYTREYDAERYVSMVAVPIMVAGYDKPWGVVNATSDQAGHFAAESSPGFKADEPIRALAAFVALAIATAKPGGREMR